MSEEGIDIGTVVDAPGLDSAVQGTAEQLMCTLPELQPCNGVAVPWEALHSCTQPSL